MSTQRMTSLLLFTAAIVAVAPANAQAAESNPFAQTNAVALFAHLPGTVAERRFPNEPQEYESKHLHIYGAPDPSRTLTGRLDDGSWVLVSGIGASSLVYRWSGGTPVVVGVLQQPLETETVAIESGAIVERVRVYSPVGPWTSGAVLIRRFTIRRGELHEIERYTVPPHFATTVREPLPNRTLDAVTFVQALADRTPGLFRICDRGRYGNGTSRYYRGETIDLYGRPDAEDSIRFSSGSARLIVVPFSSGGNGGAFTAAVYRIDRPHPILVRTLRANGHMLLRARDGAFEIYSPGYGPNDGNCCPSHYDMRRFRYDSRTGGLVTIEAHRIASTRLPGLPANAFRPFAIANNAGYPFEGTDVDALFANLPGTTVEKSDNSVGIFYVSKRYGIYGRPDPDGARSGVLADGTRALIVPFDNGFDVMIFRRFLNHTIPIGSLIGPDYVAESVTIERGTIVQRFEHVTVTYSLRNDRLIETSRVAARRARLSNSRRRHLNVLWTGARALKHDQGRRSPDENVNRPAVGI